MEKVSLWGEQTVLTPYFQFMDETMGGSCSHPLGELRSPSKRLLEQRYIGQVLPGYR